MYKIRITLLLFLISSKTYSNESLMYGIWAFDLRSTSTSNYDLKIVKDKLYWGWDKGAFQCTADYNLLYKGEGIHVPGSRDNYEKYPNYKKMAKDYVFIYIDILDNNCDSRYGPFKSKRTRYLQLVTWPRTGKKSSRDIYLRGQFKTYDAEHKALSQFHGTNLNADD